MKMNKEIIKKLVQSSLRKRKQVLVYALAKRLKEENSLRNHSSASQDIDEIWSEIESLSQLRSLVGGRFNSLKEKWLAAGFPLREHRGDREVEAKINDEAWLKLSVWINKRGFEVKLADDSSSALFEIRRKTTNIS